jgi:hypothetical protein
LLSLVGLLNKKSADTLLYVCCTHPLLTFLVVVIFVAKSL